MARTLVLAAVVLGLSGPARAFDLPSAPVKPPGYSVQDSLAFTADGGLVFTTDTSSKVRTLYRLDPGGSEPRALMTFALPPRASINGSTLMTLVEAAGPGSGFLLSEYLQGPVHRCCFAGRGPASLSYYAAAGGTGTTLRHCEGDECGVYSCE